MKNHFLVFLVSAIGGLPVSVGVIRASDMILNEYNAVGNGLLLEGDGEDLFWHRTVENGGDWFELVVITDHLDIRGW